MCIRDRRYPTLAASDKKLADYILSQPDETRHLSSQQLAAEAGVSQSSVVKFAQKLGFKGFPALKLALSEALASSPDPHSVPVHNHIRGDDPLRLVGEKLIKDNVAAMHASLDVNTEETLREAVTLLRNARRVIVTGIGASGLVARNFSWKLMKIGINAVSEQDMHAPVSYTHLGLCVTSTRLKRASKRSDWLRTKRGHRSLPGISSRRLDII